MTPNTAQRPAVCLQCQEEFDHFTSNYRPSSSKFEWDCSVHGHQATIVTTVQDERIRYLEDMVDKLLTNNAFIRKELKDCLERYGVPS